MDTIILELNTTEVNTLILEPTMNYHSIFQRELGLYKFITGKDKYSMTHLISPENVLQEKTSCDEWNPNIDFGSSCSVGVEICFNRRQMFVRVWKRGFMANLFGHANIGPNVVFET